MIYKGNDSPVLLGRVLPDHNIAYLWDTMKGKEMKAEAVLQSRNR